MALRPLASRRPVPQLAEGNQGCGGFSFGFGRTPVALQCRHFALLSTSPQPTGSALTCAAMRGRMVCFSRGVYCAFEVCVCYLLDH